MRYSPGQVDRLRVEAERRAVHFAEGSAIGQHFEPAARPAIEKWRCRIAAHWDKPGRFAQTVGRAPQEIDIAWLIQKLDDLRTLVDQHHDLEQFVLDQQGAHPMPVNLVLIRQP